MRARAALYVHHTYSSTICVLVAYEHTAAIKYENTIYVHVFAIYVRREVCVCSYTSIRYTAAITHTSILLL
jgi:hypothetical protein